MMGLISDRLYCKEKEGTYFAFLRDPFSERTLCSDDIPGVEMYLKNYGEDSSSILEKDEWTFELPMEFITNES